MGASALGSCPQSPPDNSTENKRIIIIFKLLVDIMGKILGAAGNAVKVGKDLHGDVAEQAFDLGKVVVCTQENRPVLKTGSRDPYVVKGDRSAPFF